MQLQGKRLSNYDAVKLIKQLKSTLQKNERVSKALTIYRSIDGPKDNYSINAVLNLCCDSNQPEIITSLWSDILSTNSIQKMSHPLIIKCCANALKQETISNKDIHTLIEILQHLQKYKDDISISTVLMNAYGLLSQTQNALNTFNCIAKEQTNAFCVSAMMSVYLRNDQSNEALAVYKQYDTLQNDVTHLLAIKACLNTNDYAFGQTIIDRITSPKRNNNNKPNVQLLCSLIDFFTKFGDLEKAKNIFYGVSAKNMTNILINSMMNAMIKHNHFKGALSIYQKYDRLQDDICHLFALKACMKLNDKFFAEQIIHSKIKPMKHVSIQLRTVLIDYYAKYDQMENALNIFSSIPKNKINAMTLNAMIKGYVKNNMNDLALSLYQNHSSLHDEVSHIFALKALCNGNDFGIAQNIIDRHINYRNNQYSIQVVSALMEVYSKFGRLNIIIDKFDSVADTQKDAFFIGLMMNCMLQNNQNQKALDLYQKYNQTSQIKDKESSISDGSIEGFSKWIKQSKKGQSKKICDDAMTLFALKACINLNDYNYGKQIIESYDECHIKSIELMNGMIEFYAKLGDINNAIDIFESIEDKFKNLETFNNMLHGFCLNKRYLEGMSLYNEQMQNAEPDAVTFALLLKICIRGNMENIGKEIHKQLESMPHIFNSVNVQISLLNLYAQLNDLNVCQRIFSQIKIHKIEHYNAMLNAFGRNGKIKECMDLFNELEKINKVQPNDRTLSIMINAFIEANDFKYFEMGKQMIENYQISVLKHNDICCKLIDFYGQYGDMHNAMKIFLKNQDIVSSIHMLKAFERNGLNHECVTFYNNYCKKMPIDVNKLILSGNGTFLLNSLLARLLHFGYPQNAEKIWNDIMFQHRQNHNLLSQIFYTHTLKLFILCIDKAAEYYKFHQNDNFNLCQIWNLMVRQLKIKPNLACYCCAILACSKYGNESKEFMIFDEIMLDLMNDARMINELRSISTINPKPFCQILTGLGLLSKCDQMWSFYRLIVDDDKYHNIDALNVMLEYEENNDRAKDILHIIKTNKYLSTCSLCKSFNAVNRKCSRYNHRNSENCIIYKVRNEENEYFDVNNLHLFQVIALLRAGIKFKDDRLKKHILSILNNPKINELDTNIIAMFRMNDRQCLIQNEVDKECEFDSIKKVNELMKDSDYKIDTSVCIGSLINENVREKHLKYHAEKKALAILFNESHLNGENDDLLVTVSMEMCRDCHNFFAHMSKYAQRQIVCIDPEKEHHFVDVSAMAYTARKQADLKEFFDEPKELQLKIKKLASLIRKSKHFVCYTGAGISTSCGIADYRSGINTVLKTGAGKWAKEAAAKDGTLTEEMKEKHKELRSKATKTHKAVPSPSHMALIALAEAGYLKHLVSQNTDGLHRRSGFPINRLSELHGNGTLEECSVCGKVYMRDYRCRNKKQLPKGYFSRLKYVLDQISADLQSNVYCLPDSDIQLMTELLASAGEFLRKYIHQTNYSSKSQGERDKIKEKVTYKRKDLEHQWKQILEKSNRKMPRYLHHTGRRCTIKGCGGKLTDTIINFGESLPQNTLECAEDESEKADLYLVLGSSCTVTPAADMPEGVGLKWQKEFRKNAKKSKNKRKEPVHNLCIVNIQKTPLHPVCSLPIHSKIDEVMIGVMKELGLDIPVWSLTRYLKLNVFDTTNCDKKRLCISGCDVDGTSFSLFRNVMLRQNGKRLIRLINNKEHMDHEWNFILNEWDKLSVELSFCKNYEEPNLIIGLNEYLDELIECNGQIVLKIVMDVKSKEWTVPNKKEQAMDKNVKSLWFGGNENDDQKENE